MLILFVLLKKRKKNEKKNFFEKSQLFWDVTVFLATFFRKLDKKSQNVKVGGPVLYTEFQ